MSHNVQSVKVWSEGRDRHTRGVRMQPWAFDGGPDRETMIELVQVRQMSDAEIAREYGCTRQAVQRWRRKHGLAMPGPGHGPRRQRVPRRSRKAVLPWTIKAEHANHPVRKRLVAIDKINNGEQMAPDEEARGRELLEQLARLGMVVNYDPAHINDDGTPTPFFLVPRDPKIDADGDIVRRPVDQ